MILFVEVSFSDENIITRTCEKVRFISTQCVSNWNDLNLRYIPTMSLDELVDLIEHERVECSLKQVARNRDDQQKPRQMCEHDRKPSKCLSDLADNYSHDESILRRDRLYSDSREWIDFDRYWIDEVSFQGELSLRRHFRSDRSEIESWWSKYRPSIPKLSSGISTKHWSIQSICEVYDKHRRTKNWTKIPHNAEDTDR